MQIHKEGIEILVTSLVIFVIIGVIFFLFVNPPWLKFLLIFLLAVTYCFMIWFFRDPSRITSSQAYDVIAPVDGKVVVIEKVFEKEYLKKECIQVSIFMSPLNVHVCRYPVSGKVVYTKYHPGKYLVAFHPKSSELNERTTVVVDHDKQEVLFRQIAGAVARRIVLYAKPGETAKAGEEYGFIKFGSRLDVFLPLDAKVLVKLNQKTVGGIDVIAKLNNKN